MTDNYRLVSLLRVLGKTIIFSSTFEHFQENNLLSPNQCGFRLSDSCEYQLLSIVQEIVE